jgi:hypothetical protein
MGRDLSGRPEENLNNAPRRLSNRCNRKPIINGCVITIAVEILFTLPAKRSAKTDGRGIIRNGRLEPLNRRP